MMILKLDNKKAQKSEVFRLVKKRNYSSVVALNTKISSDSDRNSSYMRKSKDSNFSLDNWRVLCKYKLCFY